MWDVIIPSSLRLLFESEFDTDVKIDKQRIHVGKDEIYEMNRTYQKFYTQLAKELIVFFFLC